MYPPDKNIQGVAERRWIRTWKVSQGGMTRPVCKQFLAILKVCLHCLAGKENCFQQSDKFAGHVLEGLHLHSVGMEVTTELLCKLNGPYTKLRVAFFF